MKIICPFLILFFCFDAFAAKNSSYHQYLGDAGNVWAGIINGVGTGGEIARQLNAAHLTDMARFNDLVGIIAFNDTALSIYEVTQHIDMAFSVLSRPMVARRDGCVPNLPGCRGGRNTMVVDAEVFASADDFDSSANGDFKTHDTGVAIRAKAYVANDISFGIEYTRTMTDTHDNKVYTDSTGNSVTIFGQYFGKNGVFFNAGLNGGHISWENDKSIAGITNKGAYDTEFFAGQLSGGVQFWRGRLSVTPHIGVRYLWLETDDHIDAAAQEFEKWWYNTLTAMAGIGVGFDFTGSDFVVRPTVSVGGGYDMLSRGTSSVGVGVLGGEMYQIPTEAPARTAANVGAGIGVYGHSFAVVLDYKLDARSDYTAHTGMLNLKIAF